MLFVTEQQNKKERIKMKTKTKNNKVPKSAKTKLSDLTPKKDARGGRYLTPPGVAANEAAGTPPGQFGKKKYPTA